MKYAINFLYLLTLFLLSPWLLYKAATTGKYRRGLGRKWTGRALIRASSAPCAWFHGVSVGEIHLLRPIVSAFRRRHPEWECVISSSTDTGFDEASKRFGDLGVFYWPFDFSWAVNAALKHVRPSLVVLAEGELWPNFLAAAKTHGVSVVVINGRMSPRSFRNYERFRAFLKPLFRTVALFLVQTEEFASRYRALGVPPSRVLVTGSVKYDGVNVDRFNPNTQDLRRFFNIRLGDLVWVAGSTQAPEEEVTLAIFKKLRNRHPNLRLFLVPRQKERFAPVTALLEKSGLGFIRRSTLVQPVADRTAVILVDTIGELAHVWGLADVAFVGGSLDGHRGGQNMIEPGAYGAAVVFGPHVWNFKETAGRLLAAEAAIQVKNPADLEKTMARLLEQVSERERLGKAAARLVREQQGATAKTLDGMDQLLVQASRQAKVA
jgi:3-deoxy-D-manno-octulosonic-acid transferase